MINNFKHFSDYFVILKHLKYSIARKIYYKEIFFQGFICPEKNAHSKQKILIFLKIQQH